ncbi:MAG: hypothetical protein AVDCRST_MAG57-1054, partial [uncultured Blastococcus sp.]
GRTGTRVVQSPRTRPRGHSAGDQADRPAG